MAKIDPLDDVGSLANTTSARAVINNNSQKIEDAFTNTVSRDGSAPNQMEADFDLNDHYLLNVADPVNEADGVNLRSVRPLVEAFASQIVETAVFGTQVVDPFTATVGQTVFALSQPPGSIENVSVFVDGVALRPALDFTISGATLQVLTLVTPLAGGEEVMIRYSRSLPSGVTQAQAVTYTPPSTGVGGTVKDYLDSLYDTGANKGATLVKMIHSGTGAVARDLQTVLREMPLSVKGYGAVGNGVADDTTAFVNAIAAAVAGNRQILIPAGTYRLTATVQVPAGVMLVGEGAQPYIAPNGTTAVPGLGSWLHFDHSGIGIQFVGSTAASAASVLRSVGTMRTHAAPGGGWAATVYDYDIDVQGVETFVDDVVLLNPYKGVRIINSGYGRLWLNRVRGQAFNEFINLEQSYDTCRVTNCHQWPYWSQHSAVTAYQQTNLKAYRVARSDTTILSGCFSIYQNVGLEVYGTVNGTAYRLRVTDCEFDHTTYGVRVLSSADDASILFSGLGSFGATGSTTSRGVWIESTNSRYSFVNTDVSLFGLDGIRVDGTNNILQMSNTRVRYYDQAAAGAAAYEVAATNLMEFADRPYVTNSGSGPMFGAVANVYKADLGAGVLSGSTNGSGDFVVTHGLGAQPSAVFLQGIATGSLQYSVQSVTSTQFTVRVYDAAGTPAASTSVNINWHAKKF